VTCAKEAPDRLRKLVDGYHPTVIFAVSSLEWTGFLSADGGYVESLSPTWERGVHEALNRFVADATRGGARLELSEMPPSIARTGSCLQADPRACVKPPSRATIATNRIFHRLKRENRRVNLVANTDLLCPRDMCPMVIDDLVVRYDGAHFTPDGARWFVRRVEPRLHLTA
jgi:hypothetical protein